VVTEVDLIALGGAALALGLIWPGLLLRWTTSRYHWIAGYNTASREEQAKYDIEGLSQHLRPGAIR
jgi:hypothetical protein